MPDFFFYLKGFAGLNHSLSKQSLLILNTLSIPTTSVYNDIGYFICFSCRHPYFTMAAYGAKIHFKQYSVKHYAYNEN